MIYLGAGDTPLRRSINRYRGLFKCIIFKYNIKCFRLGNTIKALGVKDKGHGRVIL